MFQSTHTIFWKWAKLWSRISRDREFVETSVLDKKFSLFSLFLQIHQKGGLPFEIFSWGPPSRFGIIKCVWIQNFTSIVEQGAEIAFQATSAILDFWILKRWPEIRFSECKVHPDTKFHLNRRTRRRNSITGHIRHLGSENFGNLTQDSFIPAIQTSEYQISSKSVHRKHQI